MKFLLDARVEYRVLPYLQQAGHDVTAIGFDSPAGLKDHAVLAIANGEQRLLLTNDRDFGELIFRQHLTHSGVLFFRFKGIPIQMKLRRLGEVLDRLCRSSTSLSGSHPNAHTSPKNGNTKSSLASTSKSASVLLF